MTLCVIKLVVFGKLFCVTSTPIAALYVQPGQAASGIINIKTKVDDADNKKKPVLFAGQVYWYHDVFILPQ